MVGFNHQGRWIALSKFGQILAAELLAILGLRDPMPHEKVRVSQGRGGEGNNLHTAGGELTFVTTFLHRVSSNSFVLN